MFVKYKELLLKQKKSKKHKYQAHLKGEIFFPIVSRIFFLDVSENQGRIGIHYLYVQIRARVSILDPVFLRQGPRWRNKQ